MEPSWNLTSGPPRTTRSLSGQRPQSFQLLGNKQKKKKTASAKQPGGVYNTIHNSNVPSCKLLNRRDSYPLSNKQASFGRFSWKRADPARGRPSSFCLGHQQKPTSRCAGSHQYSTTNVGIFVDKPETKVSQKNGWFPFQMCLRHPSTGPPPPILPKEHMSGIL